jgi:hypothetical protein
LVRPAVATIRRYSETETPASAFEGPAWYVSVGPGRVRIGTKDHARLHRADEREHTRRAHRVAEGSAHLLGRAEVAAARALWAAGLLDEVNPATLPDLWGPGPCDPLRPGTARSRITEWSRKSRQNMRDRYATLDFGPLVAGGLVPAMVTFTLPDGWEAIVPTGRSFKALVRAFVKRFERAWSRRLRGLWKLEFQARGAPHMHVLMVPPVGQVDGLAWRQWFASTWADLVVAALPANTENVAATRSQVYEVHEHRKASADLAEGLRASDPKRVAVYFAGHSLLKDKEYQHIVPAIWQEPGRGPGRFWGYWGLERADAAAGVTDREAVELARLLRLWQASKRGTRRASVVRVDTRTGEVKRRTVRRRLGVMRGTRGMVLVNDGPQVGLMLAEFLRLRKQDQQGSEYRTRRLALIEKRAMHTRT